VVRDIAVFIKIVRIYGLMLERWITIYERTITLIQASLPCWELNKRFKSDGFEWQDQILKEIVLFLG
jgi:hypothetical protein